MKLKYKEYSRENPQVYADLQQLKKKPDCWNTLIEKENVPCDNMNHEAKKTFAYNFFVCYMASNLRSIPPCDKSDKLDCIRDDSELFPIYTMVYQHAESLCFFKKDLLWKQRNEMSVSLLNQTSYSNLFRLYQSVSIEEDLITSLDDIIHLGERSTLYINATETKIHSIHNYMTDAFTKVKQTASDNYEKLRSLLSHIEQAVHSVLNLQTLFNLFFNNLESCITYIALTVFVFLYTDSKTTYSRRFPLLMMVLLSCLSERLLYIVLKLFVTPQVLNTLFLILRRLCFIYSLFSLLSAFYHYHDIDTRTAKMVRNLETALQAIEYHKEYTGYSIHFDHIPYYSDELYDSDGDENFTDDAIDEEFNAIPPENVYAQSLFHQFPALQVNYNPLSQPEKVMEKRYDLRQNPPYRYNPIVEYETPEIFQNLLDNAYQYNTRYDPIVEPFDVPEYGMEGYFDFDGNQTSVIS